MTRSPQYHWPEYLMEAFELMAFMISAGVVGTLLEDPGWQVTDG